MAIEQMILTVQEAMSRTIDWWGELPAPINEAIDRFRVQLAAAIDSVEFVKRAGPTGTGSALIDHDYQRNFRRANGRETSGSNSVA